MKVQEVMLFEMQAQLCALLANPKRLMIIDLISRKEEIGVGQIADTLELPISVVSQNLRLMRDKNVVISRREGHSVYYRLKHPKLMVGCHAVREVLLDELRARGEIAESMAKK